QPSAVAHASRATLLSYARNRADIYRPYCAPPPVAKMLLVTESTTAGLSKIRMESGLAYGRVTCLERRPHWLSEGSPAPATSAARRRSEAEARGRARRDRRRAGRRDLRADDDHRARLAHAGAGRPLGHVRGLHGRRFGAGPGAGARVSRPPRRRVRRRRIAPD